jgi:phage terminase large subunit-like protein
MVTLATKKGWVELDDSTLLVDLTAGFGFPVLDLVFEVTRPAAIFTIYQYEAQEEDWRYRPFSYTLLDDQKPPEEITVTGLGIENRSAKRMVTLRGEYTEIRMGSIINPTQHTEEPLGRPAAFVIWNEFF